MLIEEVFRVIKNNFRENSFNSRKKDIRVFAAKHSASLRSLRDVSESVFIADEEWFISVKIVKHAEVILYYLRKFVFICGQKSG